MFRCPPTRHSRLSGRESYEDGELLKEASRAVDQVFRDDPYLTNQENRLILNEFKARYDDRLTRPGL